MIVLPPPINQMNNGITLYGKNRYFGSLLENNNQALIRYVNKTPWVLPNQHPLVQFIILLSLDITQKDEFIYNTIAYKYQQIASSLNITSLRKPGRSFNHVIFPEKEHNTLFVVPFNNDNHPKKYFNSSLDSLCPLTTIFTTDTKIRYDTTALTNGAAYPGKSDYTVIQVDPFALGIGYIRYCRRLIKEGMDVGVNPRAYVCGLVLANFFIQHNQSVIVNLIEGDGISIESTKWNKLDITRELSEYLSFQRRQEGVIVFESFHHYTDMLSQGKYIGDRLTDSIYPDNGLSNAFNQLGWVYDFGQMNWAFKYLSALHKYGRSDDVFKSIIKKFLRNNVNTLTTSIQDPLWKHLYVNMFNDLTIIAS